jgi:hypothetical protein
VPRRRRIPARRRGGGRVLVGVVGALGPRVRDHDVAVTADIIVHQHRRVEAHPIQLHCFHILRPGRSNE